MEIKEILKQKRLERGMTLDDVARLVGVSGGTISRWESGDIANMRRDKIMKLAKALGISPAVIMGWDTQETNKPSTGAVRIPVLGRVVAGIPIDMIEEVIDWEEIPEKMAKGGEYFALQIKGDSMEPRIKDGDVVIVRQQADADSGDIVIAAINGDEATCKRLMKYETGVVLLPNNPKYLPMQYSNEEIQEKPVTILGKVVELRGKF